MAVRVTGFCVAGWAVSDLSSDANMALNDAKLAETSAGEGLIKAKSKAKGAMAKSGRMVVRVSGQSSLSSC